MDFGLVPPQLLYFKDANVWEDYTSRRACVNVELRRGRNNYLGNVFGGGDSYATMLENSLAQNSGHKRQRLNQDIDWRLDVLVFHYPDKNPSGCVRIFCDATEDSCLSRLENVCGGSSNLSVHLKLEIGSGAKRLKIEGQDKKIRTFRVSHQPKMGWRHAFNFTDALAREWSERSSEVDGKLTVSLTLTDEALDLLHLDNLDDPLSTNKKLLAETASSSDAVIIAGDGVQIKCHKGFLIAHSPVFKAMFESNMVEGLTNSVEIPDMTEHGVRALLAYLYCWEIKEAAKSCSIALELLLASNKYNIPRLEKSVRELILSKDNVWFTVSIALQLLQFAKNKAGEEGDSIYSFIEDKAAAVLRSKSTMELRECSEFQQIFNDPKNGMELCMYFMVDESNKS